LEWGFELIAKSVVDWDRITQPLAGVALRQLVEVGPIEEGSKLGGVVLFQWKRLPSRHPNTIFLYTIAIALGFSAEENWVYLANGTASILDRLIGTPVHALFSAPWGYALAVASCSTIHSGIYRRIVATWVNAIACHALVNVLSSAWRYSEPLHFLSYGLFPFLLWMFWRMEGLLQRVQSKSPIVLISGFTPIHRYWQMGLALFALILGGNAIFGFFLLARILSPLSPSQLFYTDIWWFLVNRFLLNLIPGLIAWGIYRYLRHQL
jgi:RsiW-degrading membrane proteinase PrsW (M82 family)